MMKKNPFSRAAGFVKRSWNADAFARIFLGLVALVGLFLIAYLVLKETGVLAQFDSAEKITALLERYRSVSILIFIGIQFLQVTFIPIPAAVTTVAGTYLFGPWLTVLFSLCAIIPASVFAFMLGRWFGKPFVSWMVGRETMEKYLSKSAGKERTVFFTMFLLPFFPDDALCLIAGITPMSLKYFLTMQAITRPITVVATCFLMSGTLIPYDQWWGICLYIIAFAAVIAALVLSYRYSAQIEGFVTRVIDRVLKFLHLKTGTEEHKKDGPEGPSEP